MQAPVKDRSLREGAQGSGSPVTTLLLCVRGFWGDSFFTAGGGRAFRLQEQWGGAQERIKEIHQVCRVQGRGSTCARNPPSPPSLRGFC